MAPVVKRLKRTREDVGDLQTPRTSAGQRRGAVTRNDARYKVRRYLDWLHERNLIDFGAAWLRVRGRKKTLPEPAEHFLTSLTPTLEPSTCDQYRGSLRALHDWMEAQEVALGGLNRQQSLQIIVAVRVYLRSLNDAGLLEERADDLVRTRTCPSCRCTFHGRWSPKPTNNLTGSEGPPRASREKQDGLAGRLSRSRGRSQGDWLGPAALILRADWPVSLHNASYQTSWPPQGIYFPRDFRRFPTPPVNARTSAQLRSLHRRPVTSDPPTGDLLLPEPGPGTYLAAPCAFPDEPASPRSAASPRPC
jgi:hypothetical protein